MAFGKQAAHLEDAGHPVIKLSLGEPDFGAPAAVREAMREAMDGRPLPYTEALGMPVLRQTIAQFYANATGWTSTRPASRHLRRLSSTATGVCRDDRHRR